jgi:hypothetical protein
MPMRGPWGPQNIFFQLHTCVILVVIYRFHAIGGLKHLIFIGYRGKPRFNESGGTKDFVLQGRGFVIAGTFYYGFKNTKGLEIKFLIAGILLLMESSY